jgi:hypothetical protein
MCGGELPPSNTVGNLQTDCFEYATANMNNNYIPYNLFVGMEVLETICNNRERFMK